MEIETAVRHQIPIIVVVVNNDGNAGALQQKELYPPGHERVTMFQPGIHYETIMRAFSGHGEFVTSPKQLRPALARAAASDKPACINVRVDPDAPYPLD
jgi:thiamine pyrophosphate-dependent acetolactate synthase large subunit-like protein